MIESQHFFAALHVLSEVLPYQKQLSPETRSALWELFPLEAKRDLSPADLEWAVAQRLIDPDPPKDTAISSVLIHYLYPKRDGWPAFDAGPRRLDPRTAVRDERKVFRAKDALSQPQALSAGEFADLYTQQVEPDAGVATLDALGQVMRASKFAALHKHTLSTHREPVPRGTTPPIWTDPNWMGGSRNG